MSTLDALIRRHILPIVRAYRAPSERSDAWRQDDVADDLAIAVGRVRIEWQRQAKTSQFRVQSRRAAERIDKMNAQDQARILRSVAIVDVFKSDAYLAAALPAWTAENAALIVQGGIVRGRLVRPLWDTEIAKIEKIASDGFKAGTRHEALAKKITDQLGVGRTRATLIARDQTNKLNGQLSRARQESVGFTHYGWSTAQDRRVRPEHAAQEGQIFAWATPPNTGHPGEAIQCRCVAIPKVNGGAKTGNTAGAVDTAKGGVRRQIAKERSAARAAAEAAASAATRAAAEKAAQAAAPDPRRAFDAQISEANQIWHRAGNRADAARGLAKNEIPTWERHAANGDGWPASRAAAERLRARISGLKAAARNTPDRLAISDLLDQIEDLAETGSITEAKAVRGAELLSQMRQLDSTGDFLAGMIERSSAAADVEVATIRAKLARAPAPVRDGQLRILQGAAAHHAESMKAFRQIPKAYRERLTRAGARADLVLGDVTEHPAMAHLKAVRPRGWPAGKTWKDVDGAYSPFERAAISASDGRTTTGQQSTVIGHEYGHAVDDNAFVGQRLSTKPRFLKAYTAALESDGFKAMQPHIQSYLTQPGVAGPSEAFAEFFGRFYADTGGRTGWRKDNPIMAKYFRKLEKEIKAGATHFDAADAEIRTDTAPVWANATAERIHKELAAKGIRQVTPQGPDGLIGDAPLAD